MCALITYFPEPCNAGQILQFEVTFKEMMSTFLEWIVNSSSHLPSPTLG